MSDDSPEKSRPGRPPRPMPDPMSATPEELARVLVTTPPKKNWRYMQKQQGDELRERPEPPTK